MSTCDCSADLGMGEQPAIYRRERRMARKEHKCSECGYKIHCGEVYEYASGLWHGKWRTYHTCMVCAEIGEVLCNGQYYHGGLQDQVNNSVEATTWELVRAIFIRNQRIAGLVELVEEQNAELVRLREAL